MKYGYHILTVFVYSLHSPLLGKKSVWFVKVVSHIFFVFLPLFCFH